MKKITILGISLAIIALPSCDFLDKLPEDVIEKNTFFSSANAEALEQYCNDLYPKMISGHGNPGEYSFGMLAGDFQSDNILPWDKNDIAFGQHTPPTNANEDKSSWKWGNIRACNDFLDNYMLSPELDETKHRYAGEILFFKCLDYFGKVQKYGDVPWYTHALETSSEELYKARDSRTLVMDSVLANINQAIEWLPKKTNVYRISKDAALALKARMCLFEGTFRRYHGIEGGEKFLEEAYNAAGQLMSFGYALFQGTSPEKSYYELFIQPDYNSNPEIILAKEYDPSVGKGNNLTRQIVVGETPIGMSKDCADDYLCAVTGKPISLCGCEGHTHHTTFIAELNNRDPRLLQTVGTPEPGDFTYYLKGKAPSIAKVVSSGEGTSSTGYTIVKYYNPSEYTTAHHQGTLDAPIFRYAEILLIRAEAAAELGKDPELDKTVNALRTRVGLQHALTSNPTVDPKLVDEYPTIKGNNATLIREIRRERRVELFGEGYRYADLMRWACGPNLAKNKAGMIPDPTLYTAKEIDILKNGTDTGLYPDGSLDIYGKRVQSPAVFEDPKHYLFAIPTNEISLNPKLEQNTGW